MNYDSVESAAAWLRERTGSTPGVALVMGSGISVAEELLEEVSEIPYSAIPHFPVPQVPGHRGRVVFGRSGNSTILVFEGRVHLYEGRSIEEVCFGARVIGRLGVKAVLLTNAAGAINPQFRSGHLMLLADHINLLGANPLEGINEDRWGPRFLDQTEVYDALLRGDLRIAAAACGIDIQEGVYAAVPGPTYETPAEVRYLRTIGADAVGMSTVPEAIVARHMGLRVAAISLLTNAAAASGRSQLTHQDVVKSAESMRASLAQLLGTFFRDVTL